MFHLFTLYLARRAHNSPSLSGWFHYVQTGWISIVLLEDHCVGLDIEKVCCRGR